MVPHPSLPLVALVYAHLNIVKVYRMQENSTVGVHESDFSLHGSYRQRSTSQSILDVKWIGELD